MTDLYNRFKETNLQLQGVDLNLMKTKETIAAFVSKHLGRRQFYPSPNLSPVDINDDNILFYIQNFEALKEDFIERFQDVFNIVIPN